nr:MAG: deoxynucleoside kinase-like protein [Porcellio scaber clopovirus]
MYEEKLINLFCFIMGEFIRDRILNKEIVKFFIYENYAVSFDVNKRSFRLHFKDEKSFYLDFCTLMMLFSFVRSNFKQTRYSVRNGLIPYDSGDGDKSKFLKVNCVSYDRLNRQLDYVDLYTEHFIEERNITDGKYRIRDRFCIEGENAISNFLELQCEIKVFMWHYENYEQTKLSKMILPNKLIICFEGNIGSELRSIINSFYLNDHEFSIYPEPIFGEEKNFLGFNMLEEMNENREINKNDMFSSQLCDLITVNKRFIEIRENQAKNIPQRLLGIKRCALTTGNIFLPFCMDKGFLDTVQTHILLKLIEITNVDKFLPDVVIYVQTNPYKTFKKIQTRYWEEEKNITFKDIKDLDDKYEKYINDLKDIYEVPVFKIDGNKCLGDIVSELFKLKPKIRDLLKKKLERGEEKRSLKKKEGD